MQTALLSATYDNVIFKAKQVICLESLYLKKNHSPSCQQDTENLSRFARVKSAFFKFAYSARAVHEREKIKRKSQVYMNHHPDGSLKVVMVFSALVNLSAGARYTK